MQIHKTAEAEEDLINIWSYTFRTSGAAQADKCLDNLENTFWLLAENPLIRRLREEFIPPVRIHVHEHHIIVYDVLPDLITIVRVLHESMDVKSHIDDGSV